MTQAIRNLAEAIDVLAENPGRYLDRECALSLGAFLVGYKMADASAATPTRALLERISGPSGANGCTRAFLARGGGAEGLRYAIDELREILAATKSSPIPGSMSGTPPIEHVRTALASGRIGMYFGEPTIMWVSSYVHGFLFGLSAVDPSAWARENERLNRFEQALRARYGHARPAWHELIRAFHGACEEGLERFVALWDEVQAS